LSRAGSSIFVVWQQGRDDFSSLGDFQFGRNVGDVFDAPSTSTFLVKFSRWLNSEVDRGLETQPALRTAPL